MAGGPKKAKIGGKSEEVFLEGLLGESANEDGSFALTILSASSVTHPTLLLTMPINCRGVGHLSKQHAYIGPKNGSGPFSQHCLNCLHLVGKGQVPGLRFPPLAQTQFTLNRDKHVKPGHDKEMKMYLWRNVCHIPEESIIEYLNKSCEQGGKQRTKRKRTRIKKRGMGKS
jgi:hypothetical protein